VVRRTAAHQFSEESLPLVAVIHGARCQRANIGRGSISPIDILNRLMSIGAGNIAFLLNLPPHGHKPPPTATAQLFAEATKAPPIRTTVHAPPSPRLQRNRLQPFLRRTDQTAARGFQYISVYVVPNGCIRPLYQSPPCLYAPRSNITSQRLAFKRWSQVSCLLSLLTPGIHSSRDNRDCTRLWSNTSSDPRSAQACGYFAQTVASAPSPARAPFAQPPKCVTVGILDNKTE